MKNIIITCGTSIFTNLLEEDFYKLSGEPFSYNDFKCFKDDLKELNKSNSIENKISIEFDEEMGEGNKEQIIKKYLIKGFKNINKESDFFKKLSVEISLVLNQGLFLNKEFDNIFLYYSDTLAGQLVAEILEFIFKEKIHINNVELEKINNFKVYNKEEFKTKAIPDFYKKLEEIKLNGDVTIMCPVGGYKALIPYASLYAMVNGWDIKYIYEDSDELMDLTNGLLGYLNIKNGIIDTNFIDVINELEKGEKSIFSQNIDFDFTSKLVEATNRFVELGDLSGFNKLITNDDELNKLINRLGEFDLKIKFGQIRKKEEIINIINEITNYNSKFNIFFPIFKRIKEEFESFDINNNELNYYFSILNFYKGKNKLLEGFLFMREFFVDCVSYLIFGKIYLGDEDIKIKVKELNQDNTSYKNNIKKLIEGKENKIEISNTCIKEKEIDIRYYTDFKIINDNYLKNDFEREITFNNNITKILKHNKIENGEDLSIMLKDLKNIRNYFAHYGTGEDRDGNEIIINLEKYNNYFLKLESFKNYILLERK